MFKMITKADRLNRFTIYPCLVVIVYQKVMDLRNRRESHFRQAVRGLPFWHGSGGALVLS